MSQIPLLFIYVAGEYAERKEGNFECISHGVHGAHGEIIKDTHNSQLFIFHSSLFTFKIVSNTPLEKAVVTMGAFPVRK